MISANSIIIINGITIVLMLLLAVLLSVATKMKGGAGIAAAIIVFTTIPVYIYNMSRSTGMVETARVSIYIANVANTMLLPLLWLFFKKQADRSFRIRTIDFLHFLPSFIVLIPSIILFAPMSKVEFAEYIQAESFGAESWFSILNAAVISLQVIIYFPITLLFIRKTRKIYIDHFSASDYYNFKWVSKLTVICCILFLIVMVIYFINPRTDVWLIPIINTLLMCYLVYLIVANPLALYSSESKTVSSPAHPTASGVSLTSEDMKQYCDKIISYLQSSEAYKKKDLTLRQLVDATGISENNISKSINTYLGKNFFELINGMRIECAKNAMLDSKNANYTIDGIISDCGFRSRSTFYLAFKKAEGKTPSQWLSRRILS